jgi:hypothetical protein
VRKIWDIIKPKEVCFRVDEGKLLDHVISKEGVKVDPFKNRIHSIDSPTRKQESSAIFLWKDQLHQEIYTQLCKNYKTYI